MKTIESWYRSSDGELIFYYEFLPDKKVDYVVQLIHGMAEHSGRYFEFAEFLTARGIAVYINDHRGHGRTAGSPEKTGIWNFKNAWMSIVDDVRILNDMATKNHEGKDVFIIGHSMGAFVLSTFLTEYSEGVKGAIFSGIGKTPEHMLIIGILLAKIQSLLYGLSHRSKTIDKMAFSSFNHGFSRPFQWLSRNEDIVDSYINDPYCGGVFSTSFYRSLFSGMRYNNKLYNIRKTSKSLPVLFIAGKDDPVGNFGKSVSEVCELYKTAGIKDVQIRLWEGARHEMLNETNNLEVFQYLFEWMNVKRDS